MHHPFTSRTFFKQQFNQGLQQLAEKQKMSTFILCLANATHDPDLFAQLKPSLKKQYQALCRQYQAAMQDQKSLDVVEDDLQVFLKIQALGFEHIQLSEERQEADWLCQFNQLRSFRPKRMSEFQHNGEMHIPFVDSQFHFNKPFMANECFWSGSYKGRQLDLFYNKYPFADLHGLMVPDREACLPQLLTRNMHDYIWQITDELALSLPGIAHGYNSYGAYASVNHLHFQMFVKPGGLPVSQNHWQHNQGREAYPVNIIKCTEVDAAWRIISELHNKKQAYNLLYMPDEIYIMPRKVQGSVEVPEWSSGFTWYELSGAMLVFDQQNYHHLTAESISALLKQQSV